MLVWQNLQDGRRGILRLKSLKQQAGWPAEGLAGEWFSHLHVRLKLWHDELVSLDSVSTGMMWQPSDHTKCRAIRTNCTAPGHGKIDSVTAAVGMLSSGENTNIKQSLATAFLPRQERRRGSHGSSLLWVYVVLLQVQKWKAFSELEIFTLEETRKGKVFPQILCF